MFYIVENKISIHLSYNVDVYLLVYIHYVLKTTPMLHTMT